MKKENKQRKLEEQQQERDRRFKRQGSICMGVIVGCFLVMLIVGRQCAGASWLGGFFLVMGIVIAAAFLYSLRNVSRRLKEDAQREKNG